MNILNYFNTPRWSLQTLRPLFLLACLLSAVACDRHEQVTVPEETQNKTLDDRQVENLARRSYQYVAMYNVNNKFAYKQGGWNKCSADTQLKDHTMREIARPNNDTLYISCMLDLRKDPVILEMPAFDSRYVSLMITAYDHYVNIPMSTRLGDFQRPEKMLIYSARTEGFDGERVEGVDRRFEATGDFVSAVFRIMPHAGDRARFDRIVSQMQMVKMVTLPEYRGSEASPIDDISFPPVGRTDADVFGNNLLDVMQFVFNHTTFDPSNELDQALLAAYKPLGVVPGRVKPTKTTAVDSARLRSAAERIAASALASMASPESRQDMYKMFLPKGQMTLDVLVMQSAIGPIGLPAVEAVYPPIITADGKPINAMHDYVIHMPEQRNLPPAGAFWSVTLYDTMNGFFIPNDRRKYSVGENAGMKLNDEGGIDIYIAAQKPEGVPEENWLPINREDVGIDAIMRIYVPDLKKMESWTVPTAELTK